MTPQDAVNIRVGTRLNVWKVGTRPSSCATQRQGALRRGM